MNRIVKLSEVCDFLDNQRIPIEESLRKSGKYPYYGANGIQDWVDGYIFDEPLILLAEDGGHFGSKTQPIAYKIFGKSWVNNHAHVLRPKNNCNIDYLVFILSYYDVTSIISGTTRPKLTKGNAESISFPLPPLPEQQRIAAFLQKADRLRSMRRYARQLSDGYLQSVFLEMFEGEREESRKEILGDIAEIASGVTKGQNFKGRKTIEVPYLRVANVQDGYLNLTEIKTIQALPSEVINLHLKIGDILMTEGGDYDKLGRGTIWHGEIDPCIHQNHIFRVRLDNKKLIPEFFDTYLLTRGVKNYFLTASKKTTNLATINMTQLKKLPVIIPPMKDQERFAAIYRRNKHFRNQQSESMRQAEHLFQSLLQQAFQGEP